MNYRHSFHAGNFADVMKHITLARILEYLKRKDKAFRVIDTHAGVGLYDLQGDQAGRTGEWLGGIGRLRDGIADRRAAELIAPYLDAVKAANNGSGDRFYPGSPFVTRHLLRRQDRLSAIELHPEDAESLRQLFAGDVQVRVTQLDGWLALGAHVPPKEKRGMVLVDPPFEKAGEFGRLLDGVTKVHRRWPGGIQALWYPIKDHGAVADYRRSLAASGIPKILDLSLMIRARSATPRLDGCGMTIVNPPFVLEEEMRAILPALAKLCGEDKDATWDALWLTPPQEAA